MISDETRALIRRLHFAEHWKVGTIATELGLHHGTVERAIAAEVGGAVPRPVRSTMLDPYKAFIVQTLEQHPRLRASRLHEMIRARGYAGSYTGVRRYVQTVRPRRATEAFLRMRTMPGEQAQVDWGYFGKVEVGRARRSLSCFVMVLGWSRAIYARFFYDQRQESFIRGHVQAFEALGVPREILYDNLKSAVIERVGDHIRFHPRLLELAGHYHFAPKPCAPYRGNEKGKVERAIQYLRHSFFAARTWRDLADLNAQLARWIEDVAHHRVVPDDPDRRRVADVLALERERMLPLPAHAFACDEVRGVSSGKTPYVRFDLNDYSIPHEYVGRALVLVASLDTVRLSTPEGTVVATHARSWDRGQPIEDEQHIAALASAKRHARELSGRDRLRHQCPTAERFLDAISRHGGQLGVQTRRLLRLLDHYGPNKLDAAMLDCLTRSAISASSVAHVLDQRARQQRIPPPLDLVLPDAVQDLDVIPHDLAPYDHLGDRDHDDQDSA